MEKIKTPENPDLEEVYRIAKSVRMAFELGKITVDEAIDLSTSRDSARMLSLPDNDFENELAGIESAVLNFPDNSCQVATLFLREELGIGEIIIGKATYADEDGEQYSDQHSVVKIGLDEEGTPIIADITADQFPNIGAPGIYVGPCPDWLNLEPSTTSQSNQPTQQLVAA